MKPRHRQIRFTTVELETIMAMCAIAEAGDMESGDYRDWREEQRNSIVRIVTKTSELLRRLRELRRRVEKAA